MSRKLRIAGYVFLGLTLGLGLIVGALFVLTETHFGMERVRRFALGAIADRIHGELRVKRIESKGLLGGLMLHDVAIDDDRGRPFLRADSIRLSYRWRTLLQGRIVIDRASVYRPDLYVERLPGDTLWNFARIFPSTGPPGKKSFILIDRARVANGQMVIRTPWTPSKPVTSPEDTARLILEDIPGYGLVRVLRFEDVNATLPRVLWESPVEEGKLFRVASLSTRGYVWKTPFELEDMKGEVTIRDSLIAFDVDRFRLPNSRGSALGRIVTSPTNVYDIRIVGDRVAFRDLLWLYPRLPADGRGDLVFRIQSQPVGTLWLAQDAHITAPGTDLRGDFGIVTGDTLYFTQVNLRASPIDLDLVSRVLPGKLPLEGLMVGTVVVEGPISSLTTGGDVRLSRAGRGGGAASVHWTGTLDLRPPYGVENLDATVDGLDVSLIPVLRERVPMTSRLSGRIQATGRLDRSLRFAAVVRHELANRTAAAFRGRGTLHYASREASSIDATIEADSVVLEALADAFPRLADLRGDVRGPVTVHGPLSNMTLAAELETGAGRIDVDGRFDLSRARPRYSAEARVAGFRLDRLVDGIAETALSARVAVDGTGPDSTVVLKMELDSGRVGHVDLHSGFAHVELAHGVARVDSLTLTGSAGSIDAAGTIGLDADHSGALEITAQIDSLARLDNRDMAGTGSADVNFAADSIENRMGGAAYVRASLRGAITDFEADGEARVDDLIYRMIEVGRADVRFAARGVGSDSMRVRTEGDASRVVVQGRPLDSAHATIEYDHGDGRVEFEARAAEPVVADYRLVSEFRRNGPDLEFDLREARARDWAGDWRLAGPARIRWSKLGLTVDELLLARGDDGGRVRAAGHIPWRAEDSVAPAGSLAADFRLEIERLPLAPLRVEEAGPPASALLSGVMTVAGSAAEPRMNADLRLTDVRYDEVRLDTVRARFDYAERGLEGRIEARLGDRAILTGEGRIPLDLTLAPVDERRLTEPLDFRFRADDVPAAFATGLADGFHNVRGGFTGAITLTGTTHDPVLGGEIVLRDGAATWDVTGVRYRGLEGNFRALGDQVVAVDLTGHTDNGVANATGTLTFVPLSDPTIDLSIRTREFRFARRRDAEATGTGEIRLGGRYTQPRVSGRIRIDRGVLYLDEVWHQYNMVELDDQDPLLFSVVDTSIVSVRKILPSSTSPFIKNLAVQDFSIDVGRDTWLRGRTLDVEVSGRLAVEFDRRGEDLRLTGSLSAIRGSYELYLTEDTPLRRFVVRQGTVEFDGTPGIDPRIDITATHRVRTVEGGTLNVEALVTGTLSNPRVGLRSDAEPPIAESDLLSLVLFGLPISELRRNGGGTGGPNPLLGDLAAGVAVPMAQGMASTGLSSLLTNTGFFDYFAITEWEGANADRPETSGALGNFLLRSKVELGWYLGEDWYVALSRPLALDRGPVDFLGSRVEWRFAPTWTGEIFLEDRFTRGVSLGFDPSFQPRRALGFFLFREWGF